MLAQLAVAAVLRFVKYAMRQVQREPQTPEPRENAEQRSRERCAVEQCGVKHAGTANAQGPEHIDDAGVAMLDLPQPAARHDQGREAP